MSLVKNIIIIGGLSGAYLYFQNGGNNEQKQNYGAQKKNITFETGSVGTNPNAFKDLSKILNNFNKPLTTFTPNKTIFTPNKTIFTPNKTSSSISTKKQAKTTFAPNKTIFTPNNKTTTFIPLNLPTPSSLLNSPLKSWVTTKKQAKTTFTPNKTKTTFTPKKTNYNPYKSLTSSFNFMKFGGL